MYDINKAICFTGHRTLHGVYYNKTSPSQEWVMVYNSIVAYIEKQIADGKTDYLVGGALGVDMMAGLALVHLIRDRQFQGITGWLCIPHPNYNDRWRYPRDRDDLELLKQYLNPLVLYDTGVFEMQMLNLRNHFMVDNSIKTCAVFDGRGKGGTRNCILYARKQSKQVDTIDAYNIDPTTGLLKGG